MLFGLLLTLLVMSIHSWSTASMRRVATYAIQLRCEQAARSGLQVGLSRLKTDSAWSTDVMAAMPDLPEVSYTVQFFNNFSGGGPINASDGTTVPAGMVYILSTGSCGLQRFVSGALASPGQGAALFDYALFSDGRIELSTDSRIDSWPASLPSTVPFQVGTNGIASGLVDLSTNSQIDGPLMVGPGGGPSVVDASTGSSVSGPITPLLAPKTFTTFTPPVVTGPLQSVNLSTGDSQALAPGNYNSLDASTGSTVTLTSGQYFFRGGIELSTGSRILVQNPSGPVIILVQGGVDLSTSSINPSGQPSGLQILMLSGRVELSTNSRIRGGIYGPNSTADLSTDSRVIGSVVARRASLSTGSEILFDHQMGSGGGGGGIAAGQWRLAVVRNGQ